MSVISWARKALARAGATVPREELAKAYRDHQQSIFDVARSQAKVDRLTRIAGAETLTDAALADAVNADGGAELEQFAKGGPAPIADLVAAADDAAKAARVARAALPAAEKELEAARARVRTLESEKRQRAGKVLVGHADAIAAEYVRAFERLAELHDMLCGVAGGMDAAGGSQSIILTTEPLEVPRFGLPSMPAATTYSPYLRHIPDQCRINIFASAFRLAANRLVENPSANFADLFTDKSVSAAVAASPRDGDRREITIQHRKRPPEGPTVNEVVFSDIDRTRRHMTIGASG